MASTPTNFYNCQAPVSEVLGLFRLQGLVPILIQKFVEWSVSVVGILLNST